MKTIRPRRAKPTSTKVAGVGAGRKSAAVAPKLQLKNTLVPVDFSAASKSALQQAVVFARTLGGRINLLYVEPPPLPTELAELPLVMETGNLREKAMASLRQLLRSAVPERQRGEVFLDVGAPSHRITQRAKAFRMELIVMSTHGYTGLKHVLLGSTTEGVVRHAPCPVLTVRASPRSKGLKDGISRLLVPTDFSDASRKSLVYAHALASKFAAEVTLLHVVEPPNYPRFGYAHVPLEEHKQKAAALAELEKLRRRFNQNVTVQVRTGSAHQEIAEAAQQGKFDLILLSSRGHSALAHVLLGSTTERVVRHATCPVLVLPKKGRDFVRV